MRYLALILILFLFTPAFAENEGYVVITLPSGTEDIVLLEKGYVVDPHAVVTIDVESGLRDGVYIDKNGVPHKAVPMLIDDSVPSKGYYIKDILEIDKDIPEAALIEWGWMKENGDG